MKVFIWMHKCHNVLKDGLARSVKKTASTAIDTNSKALLEQVALFDVLDGLRYGVLTIGTLGFDPLKSLGQKKGHLASESDDDDNEGGVSNNINDDEDEENDSEEEVNPLLSGRSFDDFEGSSEHEIEFNTNAIVDNSGKLRKRFTLADLLYEESDMEKKPTTLDVANANKFIPRAGKDSSPIKMLSRIIKGMLKRKNVEKEDPSIASTQGY